MTTVAATTPDSSGRDSVQPSTDINDPANLAFEDESDEEQTTSQEAGAEVEGEPDESAEETVQESEESDNDENAEEGETEEEGSDENQPIEVNVPDDALVTLSDGRKVKLGDLKRSPFFEADYTRSKQELGNRFKAVAEQATKIENVSNAIVNFLVEQMPQEPTAELAMRDPQAYIQQKALYDTALARVQGVIEMGLNVKATVQELSEAEFQQRQREAIENIVSRMPELRDPKKSEEFNELGWLAVTKIGINPERAQKNTDPDMRILAYWAGRGIKAAEAEQKVKAKVQAAPKVTPAKTGKPKGNPDFLRNKEAIRKLNKTGSINDAMNIDFD